MGIIFENLQSNVTKANKKPQSKQQSCQNKQHGVFISMILTKNVVYV